MNELDRRRAAISSIRQVVNLSQNPVELNITALNAADHFISLRRDHAEMEAARKGLQLQIRDELMTPKDGQKKTEAEELAKSDVRYLQHLEQMRELEDLRDRALVFYKLAHQRAELLGRAALVDLPHPQPHSAGSPDAVAAAHSLGGL